MLQKDLNYAKTIRNTFSLHSVLTLSLKVIGTLIKEFNDHDELVEMHFHKINDLDPFPDSFDCEMNPDYIDGGHGIQVKF